MTAGAIVDVLQDDVESLRDLAHPHLVHYYGLDHYVESDTLMLHLIMEHVGGGCLRTKIQQFNSLSPEVLVVSCAHMPAADRAYRRPASCTRAR